MIVFRVFALMIDLKIVVEVGLVTGTIPAMTPSGSAILIVWSSSLSSIIPTVLS